VLGAPPGSFCLIVPELDKRRRSCLVDRSGKPLPTSRNFYGSVLFSA
jgi:hypothetical protein